LGQINYINRTDQPRYPLTQGKRKGHTGYTYSGAEGHMMDDCGKVSFDLGEIEGHCFAMVSIDLG